MTKLPPLLLVGASGHAHALLAVLQRLAAYRVIGLIDSFLPQGSHGHGYPILGGVDDLSELCERHGVSHVLVAIGDNYQRDVMMAKVSQACPGVDFPVLIDPSAVIAHGVSIGAGSIIMPLAYVGPGSIIGMGCLLNTRSSLDHDGRMGAFASLAPGTTTGGNVSIGARSAIGLGSAIRHRITIGSDTVIGMGSLVISDWPDGVVVYGAPARLIRTRLVDEPYL
ncbi:MAG: acetyltransferase [Cyanobacteria bacterium]|nr:acetyltransferase [Cyanobacteriota bacterium]